MKIIFLHIPKTAGQSVHAKLVDACGVDNVCPARVNDHLRTLSIRQLNSYKVFSGHFDWSLLDCIEGPKYIFTVLRDPRDRILSFYFYLRESAKKLSPQLLEKPENQGLKGALTLSPGDYFTSGNSSWKSFIKNHYYNFYTYYFAGRTYDARANFEGLIKRNILNENNIIDLAKTNLEIINGVFRVEELNNAFVQISESTGISIDQKKELIANKNTVVMPSDRLLELERLGADSFLIEEIDEMCRLDKILLDSIFK